MGRSHVLRRNERRESGRCYDLSELVGPKPLVVCFPQFAQLQNLSLSFAREKKGVYIRYMYVYIYMYNINLNININICVYHATTLPPYHFSLPHIVFAFSL